MNFPSRENAKESRFREEKERENYRKKIAESFLKIVASSDLRKQSISHRATPAELKGRKRKRKKNRNRKF